jgi:hypothetical protein
MRTRELSSTSRWNSVLCTAHARGARSLENGGNQLPTDAANAHLPLDLEAVLRRDGPVVRTHGHQHATRDVVGGRRADRPQAGPGSDKWARLHHHPTIRGGRVRCLVPERTRRRRVLRWRLPDHAVHHQARSSWPIKAPANGSLAIRYCERSSPVEPQPRTPRPEPVP